MKPRQFFHSPRRTRVAPGLLLALAAAVAVAGCSGGAAVLPTPPAQGGSSPPGGEPGTGNQPPRISGSPESSVSPGDAYAFTPTASDPEGSALTFSIAGLPRWARFDAATGRVTGTPSTRDVGTYVNIVISVSDGTNSTAMPGFTITVRSAANGTAWLSWVPPTQRIDGSPLTDLAGYRIYTGPNPGSMTLAATLASPTTTSYAFDGLRPGTHYFAVSAYTTAGIESALSEPGSKTIP